MPYMKNRWSSLCVVVESAFSTQFKYSRFDLLEARPRDVSKLTGHKHPFTPSAARRPASSSAFDAAVTAAA